MIINCNINTYADDIDLNSIEYICSKCNTNIILIGDSAKNIIRRTDIISGKSSTFCPECTTFIQLQIL